MTLHDDWKHIFKNAWSMRWMGLAGLFSTGEAVMPVFLGRMSIGIFAILTLVCIVGGMLSRVLCQPKDGL